MVKIGQKLHDTRINKSLSLEEIARATKIRPQFLTAIERGEYEKLPSAAYAQGFVRNYASYLGLSQKEVLPLFKREFDEKKSIKVLPDGLTKNDGFALTRITIRRSFFLLTFILVGLLIYLGFQYRAMFLSPMLAVDYPEEGASINKEVTISGKTDPNATVIINNESASINSKGEFAKNITLFPGNTLLVIKAQNRLGKETVLERNVDVK